MTGGQVKRVYTEMRRVYHPNYTPNPRWDSIWDQIAAFITENELDGPMFVEAQFRAVRPFPMPNNLIGPNALARYQRILPDPDGEARKRFDYEVSHLETYMKLMDVRRILEEEPSTLSPLFRYCVAHQFQLWDLVNSLHDVALFQLVTDKPSRQLYRKWVPQKLWEELLHA